MPSLEKKKGVELYTTCGVCGMPMRQGPGNSLTSWIFRERRCMCARQENSDEPSGNREGKQDNPPPESAKNLSDRYEILATLGQGGMGTVYRVRNKELDKQFALKVLRSELAFDREAVKRFEHEVKAAQSLSHPNLVSVYDFGIGDDGSPFYVMDLIEGETLAGIFRQDGALPFLRVLDIFSQACDALQYAHDHNVIHRDLKPSNILIAKTEDGSDLVKIVDFGIAKILPTPGRETLSLTKTAEIFGSPVYMSPEQCKGDRVDFRSDIYSLGCVLHEALCGRPPFAGENPVKTLLAHIYDAPSLIKETLKEKGLLAELEEVLRTCLAKDPMQRYQSMSSLQHDLHSLKEGRQTAAGRKVASRKRRQHLKFAVVKYFPLVLVLFTTYLLFLAIWDLPFTLAVQDIKLARSVAPKMANNDALDKLLAKADAHNLPFALWMTADIHWQRGDVKRALLDGERALALFENSHRYRNAVWACQLLMRYQLRQGNFAKAEELASHALDLRERSLNAPPEKGLRFIGWFYGPSPSVNSTCLEIAGLLANYGDKSAAKSFYERLLSSMEKHDEAGLGQVLSQYAAFLYSIEDRKKAREVTDQAIARYRMTQDELWRVRDIAAAALNAGDFVAAQDLYTMLDQDGGWMSLPDLMRMAVAYSKTDTDRAHELYQFHVKIRLLSNTDSDRYDYFWQQTCDELFAQGKDGYLDNLFTSMIPILERSSGSEREERSRIELETMYAEYLWKMGRTQESNKYRQQALHEWLSSSRKGNTRHIIKSIYRLSILAGDYAKAHQTARILVQLDDESARHVPRETIAERVREDRARMAAADAFQGSLKEAEDQYKELQNTALEPHVLVALANINIERGNYPLAQSILARFLQSDKANHNPQLRIAATISLSRVLQNEGKNANAKDLLESALSSIPATSDLSSLRLLKEYESLLQKSGDQKKAQEVSQRIERLKRGMTINSHTVNAEFNDAILCFDKQRLKELKWR